MKPEKVKMDSELRKSALSSVETSVRRKQREKDFEIHTPISTGVINPALRMGQKKTKRKGLIVSC